jgi:hypothetical protein
VARGDEPRHQGVDVLLEERLAAGDLDQAAPVPLHLLQDLVHAHLPPLVERVRRVAPPAPEVAGREPYEDAALPGVRGLTLNRVKNLVNGEHLPNIVRPGGTLTRPGAPGPGRAPIQYGHVRPSPLLLEADVHDVPPRA